MFTKNELKLLLCILAMAGLAGLGWWFRPRTAAGTITYKPAASPPPAAAPAPVQAAETSAPAPMLDINTADAAALERLKGIGPHLAQQIIAFREQKGPYRRPEDLLRVKGIGPKKLDGFRAQLKF